MSSSIPANSMPLCKVIVLLCLGLLWTETGSTMNLDSIRQQMHAQTDSAKYFSLGYIRSHYVNANEMDSCWRVTTEMQELANKQDDSVWVARIYSIFGLNYHKVGQHDSALTNYRKTWRLLKRYPLPILEASTAINLGITHVRMGALDSALIYYEQAIPLKLAVKDTYDVAKSHNNIGLVLRSKGDFEGALNAFLESMSWYERIDNQLGVAQVLSNIGGIYFKQNAFDEAAKCFMRSIAAKKTFNDTRGITNALNNLAGVYHAKGDIDSCLIILEECLRIRRETNDYKRIPSVLNNMGRVFLETGELTKAKQVFTEAHELRLEFNEGEEVLKSFVSMGRLNMQMNDLKQAKKYASQAEELAVKMNSDLYMEDVYGLKYEIFKEAGETAKALEMLEKEFDLSKKMFNQQAAESIAEIEKKYKTEKKQREIEKLTAEQEIDQLKIATQEALLQKNRAQKVGLAIVLAIAVIMGWLIFNRYKLQQQARENAIQKQYLEIERKLLRSQMNPHFIFNSLNSIQSYISENDPYLAEVYLSKFARLMRYILENSRQSMVPVEDEIKTLELYLELEQLRFDKRFDFDIELSDEIDEEFTHIPPMLVQPFAENAILHGLSTKTEPGHLHIAFARVNGSVKCTIEDDGIGRKASQAKQSGMPKNRKSLGMQVTSERLELMNKKNVDHFRVDIFDLMTDSGESKGTRVEVLMPCEEG